MTLFASLFALALAGTDVNAQIASQGSATLATIDVDARVLAIPDDKRAGVFDDPVRIESIVQSALLNRQLANEARRDGLDKDPVVARAILLATEEILARERLRKVREASSIDADTLAREMYLANPKAYANEEKRIARHILLRTEGSDPVEVRARLESLRKEIAGGASFEDIARQNSQDEATKAAGGQLPAFGRGVMTKVFEDATFALQPEQISPIVETEFGLHLIQLIGTVPAHQKSFEEARPEIVAKLLTEQRERVVRNHIDLLRNQPIDADPEAIAALRTRYAEDAPAAATPPTPKN